MKKELIIATYNRKYDWISKIDNSVNIKIYTKNKLTTNKNEIIIPNNVGRCVHTFFYHIFNEYDNLADYTFFSQDYCQDHVANYDEIINGNIETWNRYAKQSFEEYWCFHSSPGNNWPNSSQFGGKVFQCDLNGAPHHRGLDIENAWNLFFKINSPKIIEFVPAGHFCISKEQVRIRPKEFYKKLLYFLEFNHAAPWIIERLEPYIFNSSVEIKKVYE